MIRVRRSRTLPNLIRRLRHSVMVLPTTRPQPRQNSPSKVTRPRLSTNVRNIRVLLMIVSHHHRRPRQRLLFHVNVRQPRSTQRISTLTINIRTSHTNRTNFRRSLSTITNIVTSQRTGIQSTSVLSHHPNTRSRTNQSILRIKRTIPMLIQSNRLNQVNPTRHQVSKNRQTILNRTHILSS